MKDSVRDSQYKVYGTTGYSVTARDAGTIDGTVDTEFGVVEVWAEERFMRGKRNTSVYYPAAGMSMILNGRYHSRHVERHNLRPFTKRGLTTMAGRFAREIGTRELRDALDALRREIMTTQNAAQCNMSVSRGR